MKIGRRDLVKTSLGVSGGLLGIMSYEHQDSHGQLVDRSQYRKVKEPVKGLQCGKLGKYGVSRLIIGGNLISGSAHAGELLYQSALMTRYFKPRRSWKRGPSGRERHQYHADASRSTYYRPLSKVHARAPWKAAMRSPRPNRVTR
jgi:hypothetical protein